MKYIFRSLSILLVVSCSSVRVVSTETYEADFTGYTTYNFFKPDAATGPYYNDLIKAIENELNARGLSMSESPDLKINIGTSVTDVTQTRETDYRDIRYTGQRNYEWSSEEVVVNQYKEGTVVLDFVEESSGKLVWQGIASSMLDGKEEKMISRIDEAMAKLFERFPIQ